MPTMIISDHTIWMKHIENGESLVRRLASLDANAPISCVLMASLFCSARCGMGRMAGPPPE